LKGQDIGKTIAMLAILTGVVFMTLGEIFDLQIANDIGAWVRDLFRLTQA